MKKYSVLLLIPALLIMFMVSCKNPVSNPTSPTATITRTSTATISADTATITMTSTEVVVDSATATATEMDTATATATASATATPKGTAIVVPLGAASTFGVFGGTAGATNMGLNTVVKGVGVAIGNLGTTAASSAITGYHDSATIYTETTDNVGNVTGTISYSGTTADAVLGAATTAYNYLKDLPVGSAQGSGGNLGGLTLYPGTYTSSGAYTITGSNLILDALGDADAVFVFQMPSSLTVGDAAPCSVLLQGSAQAKNVYWQVGSSAVINYAGGGVMEGTIIANTGGITFSSPANATSSTLTVLHGSALSLVASVTLVNTVITVQ